MNIVDIRFTVYDIRFTVYGVRYAVYGKIPKPQTLYLKPQTVLHLMNIDDHEIRYRLLKLLGEDPNLTQRQMAEKIGISLGKFNYCLKELVKKGFVKINRFTSSDNKAAYMYILTPQGVEQKSKITVNFLKRKMAEYDQLKREIRELTQEVSREP